MNNKELLQQAKNAWAVNDVTIVENILLQCDTNDPKIQYLLGELYLYTGNYSRAWALWESRNFLINYKDKYNKPRWDGSFNPDKVIIKFEQGLGDALQFSRYIPMLKNLFPCLIIEVPLNMYIAWKDFTLEVPSLKKLFSVFEDDNTKIVAYDFHSESYDAWFPLLSSPFIFKTTYDTIPPPVNLRPKQPYWRFQPEKYKSEITMAWKGSSTHPDDKNRSIPKELVEKFIRKHPSIIFHNVHPTESLDADNVINHGNSITDIIDIADICQRSNLVISVDTSIAHLAATCGCPTHILLPYSCDWRWKISGSTTNWYPTAVLNRQKVIGDWNSTLDNIFI